MARGLPLLPDMTLVSSRPLALRRPRVRVQVEGLNGPLPHRTGRRGRRGIPSRLGLLRLAPTLSIVPGTPRVANWPVIAGGIGAAMNDGFDPDDSPLCA
jgi:hypothetical protein